MHDCCVFFILNGVCLFVRFMLNVGELALHCLVSDKIKEFEQKIEGKLVEF